MSTLGEDLHPLAQAVLRYYLEDGAARTALEETGFLDELFTMVNRLDGTALLAALDDLLIVAQFLRAEHMPRSAVEVAGRVETSARRGTVRAVGSGALSDVSERAGVQLASMEGRRDTLAAPTERAEAPSPSPRRGPSLEEKWEQMSEERREKLARLAAQLGGRDTD